jgi:hypothetical protein
MSAGQTHIAKKYVDSHATNDPTDEVAHDNYKSRQEKEKELNKIRNKPGYADRVKELKDALSNRAEWEREKKLGNKTLYF